MSDNALVVRGQVVDGSVVDHVGCEIEIDTLKDEVRRLREDLKDARDEAAQAKRHAERSMGGIRRQLTPFYRALQVLFGELDAAGVADDGVGYGAVPPRTANIWESWKQKMPGKPAEFIAILLEHGEMSAAQLKIAARCSSDTVYQTIHKLNKAGLVQKNGGRFSLKTL